MNANKNTLVLDENELLKDVVLTDLEKNQITSLKFDCMDNDVKHLNNYKNLKKVILNDSNTYVPVSAFYRFKIRNLQLGANTKMIYNEAFNGNQLKSLTIPKNVVRIYPYAFANNYLETINFQNENIEYIGKYAFFNNNLKSIVLDNIKLIENEAFTENALLEKVVLKNVEKVEPYAFLNLHLKEFEFDVKTQINDLKLHFDSKLTFRDGEKETVLENFMGKRLCCKNNNVYILAEHNLIIYYEGEVYYLSSKWKTFNDELLKCLDVYMKYKKETKRPLPLPDYNLIMLMKNQEDMLNYFRSYFTFKKLFKKLALPEPYIEPFYFFCRQLGLFHYTNASEEPNNYKVRARVCDFIRELKESDCNLYTLINSFYSMDKFNPQFARIFMQNYKEFIDNEGLFKHFVDNLASLTKNKKNKFGKTLQLQFIDVYNDYSKDLQNVEERYRPLVFELKKYLAGSISYDSHLKNAISLMNIACEIVDDYKNGSKTDYFCFVKDEQENSDFTYAFMQKNDPKIVSVAHDCDCCSKFGYVGEDILESIMTDENYGLLVFKDKDKKIIAKSTLFLDFENQRCYVNSFEVNKNFYGDAVSNIIGYSSYEDKEKLFQTLIRALNEYVKAFNWQFKDKKIRKVLFGDVAKKFDQLCVKFNIPEVSKITNIKWGGIMSYYNKQYLIVDKTKKKKQDSILSVEINF